jgi:hypothetical protein
VYIVETRAPRFLAANNAQRVLSVYSGRGAIDQSVDGVNNGRGQRRAHPAQYWHSYRAPVKLDIRTRHDAMKPIVRGSCNRLSR